MLTTLIASLSLSGAGSLRYRLDALDRHLAGLLRLDAPIRICSSLVYRKRLRSGAWLTKDLALSPHRWQYSTQRNILGADTSFPERAWFGAMPKASHLKDAERTVRSHYEPAHMIQRSEGGQAPREHCIRVS